MPVLILDAALLALYLLKSYAVFGSPLNILLLNSNLILLVAIHLQLVLAECYSIWDGSFSSILRIWIHLVFIWNLCVINVLQRNEIHNWVLVWLLLVLVWIRLDNWFLQFEIQTWLVEVPIKHTHFSIKIHSSNTPAYKHRLPRCAVLLISVCCPSF